MSSATHTFHLSVTSEPSARLISLRIPLVYDTLLMEVTVMQPWSPAVTGENMTSLELGSGDDREHVLFCFWHQGTIHPVTGILVML